MWLFLANETAQTNLQIFILVPLLCVRTSSTYEEFLHYAHTLSIKVIKSDRFYTEPKLSAVFTMQLTKRKMWIEKLTKIKYCCMVLPSC